MQTANVPQAEGQQEDGVSYRRTMYLALAGWKVLAGAALATFVYLALFAYASRMIRRVSEPQFLRVSAEDLPYFEAYLNPIGYMPYIAYQPFASWYLEINLLQGTELLAIGLLVTVNAALATLLIRLGQVRRRPGALLPGAIPLLASNGACAACAGVPAALSFIPASLAGGVLGFAGFYGLPALIAIPVLLASALWQLDRANSALSCPTSSTEKIVET